MSEATVWLRDVQVGTLGFASGSSAFRFERNYRDMPNRPVLSQQFEQRGLDRAYQSGAGLPAFFVHLLPPNGSELRALLDRMLENPGDARLLEHLGQSLPGAVRVLLARTAEAQTPAPAGSQASGPLRFSLGGMQLKFSADKPSWEPRFALPAAGLGGQWILKAPAMGWPDLARTERLVTAWAGLLGITVPESGLVAALQGPEPARVPPRRHAVAGNTPL
ncbi:MAG: HipA N-terminal domain-containing protein [Deltaproteobacteria bacterium]|nr:HipA N-terminal domain-containing protein [Deltaproteobacteria bacterium]